MAPFWKKIQLVQTHKQKEKTSNKRKLMIWRTKMQAKKVQDPKSGKSRLNIHCTILEGNSIGSNHKLEKRALK
jgi:hypothetical protein